MEQTKDELKKRCEALFEELHAVVDTTWNGMLDEGLGNVEAEQVLCIVLNELTGYVTAAALIDGVETKSITKTARAGHISGVEALHKQHKIDCEEPAKCRVEEVLGKYLRGFRE